MMTVSGEKRKVAIIGGGITGLAAAFYMQKEAKEKDFIQKPTYAGGPKAMRAFISQHLRYPQAALANRTEGTVVLKYDIDYLGKVIEVKVISGPGDGCREEAIRLVKMLEFTPPKTKRGLKVTFHRSLKIHFRLPKVKPKPQPAAPKHTTSLGYTYTLSKADQAEGKKEKKTTGKSYFYQINIG